MTTFAFRCVSYLLYGENAQCLIVEANMEKYFHRFDFKLAPFFIFPIFLTNWITITEAKAVNIPVAIKHTVIDCVYPYIDLHVCCTFEKQVSLNYEDNIVHSTVQSV
jgi:hypothetical protein